MPDQRPTERQIEGVSSTYLTAPRPKHMLLDSLKQQITSIRNGAIPAIFSVNVQTTNDDPSFPSANSFPLILELQSESTELLDAVCQVLIHSGTGNILKVRSSYLDFHDGSDPRPLIHIGFTNTYISTYLSNDDPSFDPSLHLSDSQQKVQLLRKHSQVGWLQAWNTKNGM